MCVIHRVKSYGTFHMCVQVVFLLAPSIMYISVYLNYTDVFWQSQMHCSNMTSSLPQHLFNMFGIIISSIAHKVRYCKFYVLQNGLTPLHLATRKSFVKVVEKLVSAGAYIGIRSHFFVSLLTYLHNAEICIRLKMHTLALSYNVNLEI